MRFSRTGLDLKYQERYPRYYYMYATSVTTALNLYIYSRARFIRDSVSSAIYISFLLYEGFKLSPRDFLG